MNFHLLSPNFSSLPIPSFPISVATDTNKKINEHFDYSLSDSLPCFSVEDQLLNFLVYYYFVHPEEKTQTPLLLLIEGPLFKQHPLVSAVLKFLAKERQLGSDSPILFTFQELLKFINPQEVEWIGSSLTEFLIPYLEELCIQQLLPKDLKEQEAFKSLLSNWFRHPSVLKKLAKKGADYDLRLVKQNQPKEQTNQALNFFKSKIPQHASSPLHIFATVLKDSGLLDKRWAAQAQAIDYYAMIAFNLTNDKPLEIICVNRLTSDRLSLEKTHLSNTNCLRLLLHKAWSSHPSLEISTAPFCAQDFLIYVLGNVWNVSDDQTLDSATWIRYLRDDGRSIQPYLTRKIIQAIKKNYPSNEEFYQHVCDKLEKEMIKNKLSLFTSFELLFRALQSLHEHQSLPSSYLNKMCEAFQLKRGWNLPNESVEPSLFHLLFQLLCIKHVPFAQVSAALTLGCTLCFPESLSHRDQQLAFHLVINQGQQEWKCWFAFDLEQAMESLTDLDLFFEIYQVLPLVSSPATGLLASYLGKQKAKIKSLAWRWISQTTPQAILLGWQVYHLTLDRSLTTQESYQLLEVLPRLFPFLNKQWINGFLYGLKAPYFKEETLLLLKLQEVLLLSKEKLEFFWIKQLFQTHSSSCISLAYQLILQVLETDPPVGLTYFKLLCLSYPMRALQMLKKIMQHPSLSLDEKMNEIKNLVKSYQKSFPTLYLTDQETNKKLGEITLELLASENPSVLTHYSEFFHKILSNLYSFTSLHSLGDSLLLEATQKQVLSVDHLHTLWLMRLNHLLLTHYSQAALLWYQGYQTKGWKELIKTFHQEWEPIIHQLMAQPLLLENTALKWNLLEQKLRISSKQTDFLPLLELLHQLLIAKETPLPTIQNWMEKAQLSILTTFKTHQLPFEAQTFLTALLSLHLKCQPSSLILHWLCQSFNQVNSSELIKLLIKEERLEDSFQALISLDPLLLLDFLKRFHAQLSLPLLTRCLTHIGEITDPSFVLQRMEWIEQLNQQGHFAEAFELLKTGDYSNCADQAVAQGLILLNQWKETNQQAKIKDILFHEQLKGLVYYLSDLKAFALLEINALLSQLTLPHLQKIIFLLNHYEGEEKEWLACWKSVSASQSPELIACLWTSTLQSNLLVHSQSSEGADTWLCALQAFISIKDPRQAADFLHSWTHLKWLEVKELIAQKLFFYQLLINRTFSFAQDVSRNNKSFEQAISIFEELKPQAQQLGAHLPTSPDFPAYQYFITSISLELANYCSKNLTAEHLIQAVAYFKMSQEVICKDYALVPTFKLQLKTLNLNFYSFIASELTPSLELIRAYFYLNEQSASYFLFSFEEQTNILKKTIDLSLHLQNEPDYALILERQLESLNKLTRDTDFKKNLFAGVVKACIKLAKDLDQPKLSRQVIQFLHSVNDLGLYPQEKQKLFGEFYMSYLKKTPEIEDQIVVFNLVISQLFAHPTLSIECLKSYIQSMSKNDSEKTYLYSAISWTLDYPLSVVNKQREEEIKNLRLYRHHFLKTCVELNCSKSFIVQLLVQLLESGIKKNLSLFILNPLFNDLVYFITYGKDFVTINITNESNKPERKTDFKKIESLLKKTFVFYKEKKEDCSKINEYLYFIQHLFTLNPNNSNKLLTRDYLTHSIQQLLVYDSIFSYRDLIKILKFFVDQDLLDHSYFLTTYNQLLKVSSSEYINYTINGNSLLELIYEICNDITPLKSLTTYRKYLVELIYLQSNTLYSLLDKSFKDCSPQLQDQYLTLFFKILRNEINTNKSISKITFKNYFNHLKMLTSVILTQEITQSTTNNFLEKIVPFFSLKNKFFIDWIDLFKLVSFNFNEKEQKALLFQLLKEWMIQIETLSSQSLKPEVIDLLLLILKELTISELLVEGEKNLSVTTEHLFGYQITWLLPGCFTQNLGFNQSNLARINYSVGQTPTFRESEEIHATYFDQLYERLSKKSSFSQQMQLELICFCFYQNRFEQQPSYYNKYVESLMSLFPNVGLEALHQIGFLGAIFQLPISRRFSLCAEYKDIQEKNEKEWIPKFLENTEKLINTFFYSQNIQDQRFIYLNCLMTVNQLKILYPALEGSQALDLLMECLNKMRSLLVIDNECLNIIINSAKYFRKLVSANQSSIKILM